MHSNLNNTGSKFNRSETLNERKSRFDTYSYLVHQSIENYRGIGTVSEKDDLLQEGYECLWMLISQNNFHDEEFKKLATIKIASRLRAVRRDQNKIRRLLPRLADLPDSAFQLSSDNPQFEAIVADLETAVKKLSPKQQRSITSIFGLEEWQESVEEIANQDCKTPRAIWGRRERGLIKLRQDLNLQSFIS
jgi:DNA-directed RNA polymerase specialized sigma24 family protein